ncbi:DUF3710 domain-containing protein [Streptomyces sp. Isolate_45]|uniref:DUF3710 domain-containing protein n=1 Tax=Streptomyces sp. Isolate_45 TaxID=2950111 RepID=UPI0024820F61|nr:DUF3710 domain-containing protein [Streptomyces sp. Isolate_45]MDA5283695.1 DUF3710 domain-containing protein [Streptomyces sp. Isolate_45]
MEINKVASLLHGYMSEAGKTISSVHAALTVDMLPAGVEVPSQRKMYALMEGNGLSQAIAHAVIDICSGLDGDAAVDDARRAEVDALFERARVNPTPVRADSSTHRDLADAQQALIRTQQTLIQAQQDLESANDALRASTAATLQAQLIVVGLEKIRDEQDIVIERLTGERDELRARLDSLPTHRPQLELLEQRMLRMRDSEEKIRSTLRQAEHDRDQAHAVAREARRVSEELRREVLALRASAPDTDPAAPGTAIALPDPAIGGFDAGIAFAEAALHQAERLLARGREAVEEAGRTIGYVPDSELDIIDGEVLSEVIHPADASEHGFSGTTPENPSTSDNESRQSRQARHAEEDRRELRMRRARETWGTDRARIQESAEDPPDAHDLHEQDPDSTQPGDDESRRNGQSDAWYAERERLVEFQVEMEERWRRQRREIGVTDRSRTRESVQEPPAAADLHEEVQGKPVGDAGPSEAGTPPAEGLVDTPVAADIPSGELSPRLSEDVADPPTPRALPGFTPRPEGPWDVSEVADPAQGRVCLGPLYVRKVEGLTVRFGMSEGKPVGLIGELEGHRFEIRLFPGSRENGSWNKHSSEAVKELQKYGDPLLLRVEPTLSMYHWGPGFVTRKGLGKGAGQVILIGCDGPGWVLRLTWFRPHPSVDSPDALQRFSRLLSTLMQGLVIDPAGSETPESFVLRYPEMPQSEAAPQPTTQRGLDPQPQTIQRREPEHRRNPSLRLPTIRRRHPARHVPTTDLPTPVTSPSSERQATIVGTDTTSPAHDASPQDASSKGQQSTSVRKKPTMRLFLIRGLIVAIGLLNVWAMFAAIIQRDIAKSTYYLIAVSSLVALGFLGVLLRSPATRSERKRSGP